LAGGTQLTLQMSNFPPGQDKGAVQQKTIDILQKRVNTLGVSEPIIQAAGGNHDRIDVQLAGVTADQANKLVGRRDQLVITTWVKDQAITGGPFPGYRPQMTQMTSDMLTNANASIDPAGGTSWVVNFTFDSRGADIFGK